MSEKNKDYLNKLAASEKEKKDKEELEKKKKETAEKSLNLKKHIEKNKLLDEIKKKLVDFELDIKNGNESKIYNEISKLVENSKLSLAEVKDILEKIDEIISITIKKQKIPKEFLFSKKDYLQALEDSKKKEEVLNKLNKILDFTSSKLQPVDNLFLLAGFYLLVDKDIQIVHDNCIDLKDNLES